MATAENIKHVSVDEYLAGEVDAKERHEYLGGHVYAMAGGTNAHNRIASNLHGNLFSAIAGEAVPALQLGYEDSCPAFLAYSLLLSRRVGDL